jgi:hypothetical protein
MTTKPRPKLHDKVDFRAGREGPRVGRLQGAARLPRLDLQQGRRRRAGQGPNAK